MLLRSHSQWSRPLATSIECLLEDLMDRKQQLSYSLILENIWCHNINHFRFENNNCKHTRITKPKGCAVWSYKLPLDLNKHAFNMSPHTPLCCLKLRAASWSQQTCLQYITIHSVDQIDMTQLLFSPYIYQGKCYNTYHTLFVFIVWLRLFYIMFFTG